MRVKKTALIICQNGKEFWVTQKKFWNMVREGMVIQTGDYPLTGKFRGREEHLLVMINIRSLIRRLRFIRARFCTHVGSAGSSVKPDPHRVRQQQNVTARAETLKDSARAVTLFLS